MFTMNYKIPFWFINTLGECSLHFEVAKANESVT